jgi:hypothetical protein
MLHGFYTFALASLFNYSYINSDWGVCVHFSVPYFTPNMGLFCRLSTIPLIMVKFK